MLTLYMKLKNHYRLSVNIIYRMYKMKLRKLPEPKRVLFVYEQQLDILKAPGSTLQ
jgi:hypothetical protein